MHFHQGYEKLCEKLPFAGGSVGVMQRFPAKCCLRIGGFLADVIVKPGGIEVIYEVLKIFRRKAFVAATG